MSQNNEENKEEEYKFNWTWAIVAGMATAIPVVAVPLYIHNKREENRYLSESDFEQEVSTDHEIYFELPNKNKNIIEKLWGSVKSTFGLSSDKESFEQIEYKYGPIVEENNDYYLDQRWDENGESYDVKVYASPRTELYEIDLTSNNHEEEFNEWENDSNSNFTDLDDL